MTDYVHSNIADILTDDDYKRMFSGVRVVKPCKGMITHCIPELKSLQMVLKNWE